MVGYMFQVSYDTGEDLWLEVNRFSLEGNKLGNPTRIIADIPCNVNHSGGRLRFGPDGKLYLTTSDINQPPLAQNLDNLIGKVLRFNADGSIPDDNPFVGTEGARPENFTYGHRNPQGLFFHPQDGSLWETEHGNKLWDEFNLLYPKNNYGWPVIEGTATRHGMEPPALSLVDDPAANAAPWCFRAW
jgi:glucose/arabinose dehydrogenase